MMRNVEHRFDQSDSNHGRSQREHHNIRTTAADHKNFGISGLTMHRIGALQSQASDTERATKQRKISNKTKEMLIKSKAIGNPSVSMEDRIYLAVHLTASLDILEQQTNASKANISNHQTVYLYFPRRLSVGECLQNIRVNYGQLIERSASFRSDRSLNHLRQDDISLAMCTLDTPDWKLWDRNTPIGLCLSAYEEVLVFAVPLQDAVRAQNEVHRRRTAAIEQSRPQAKHQSHQLYQHQHHHQHQHQHQQQHSPGGMFHQPSPPRYPPQQSHGKPPVSSHQGAPQASAGADAGPLLAPLAIAKTATYTKGQQAWYHRIPKADLEQMHMTSVPILEKQLPMVLVRIVGVHHDDFPNIYYTIQQAEPLQTTDVAGAAEVGFVHEKQTDNYHLFPFARSLAEATASGAGASAGVGGGKVIDGTAAAASAKSSSPASSARAVMDMMDAMAAQGRPLTIRASHGKHDGGSITIGDGCTVGQLKALLGAIFNIPVPSLKVICRGSTLSVDQLLIRDSKIVNGSKLVVMGTATQSPLKGVFTV